MSGKGIDGIGIVVLTLFVSLLVIAGAVYYNVSTSNCCGGGGPGSPIVYPSVVVNNSQVEWKIVNTTSYDLTVPVYWMGRWVMSATNLTGLDIGIRIARSDTVNSALTVSIRSLIPAGNFDNAGIYPNPVFVPALGSVVVQLMLVFNDTHSIGPVSAYQGEFYAAGQFGIDIFAFNTGGPS